jgi:hypothetical protein
VYSNDIGQSMLFTAIFLATIVGLLFLLAWLEQPAAERWRPRWWAVRHFSRGRPPQPALPGGISRGERSERPSGSR